ncbi:MAG: helix-turn-helix transcriptional regulator [Lentisphaerae bacterium]|nr:helix-turn-helix transcriptional regulator [Lentisphaerota bacterium]
MKRTENTTGTGSSERPRPRDDTPGRWKITPSTESDPAKLLHALRERVKELNCLYGIAQIAERFPSSLEDLLAAVVQNLPAAWQYPETACARIVFGAARYETPGYIQAPWRQYAPIRVSGQAVGEVSVCYREERPMAFEGPFLREERTLIDAVAEYLGTIARRVAAERELHAANRMLTVERETLKESNTALRAVLARIGDERRELCRDIHANVERILLPILDVLSLELAPPRRGYVDLLRRNLLELTAPFTRHVAAPHLALTPTEISVCGMIRSGLRTKEIARLRGISPATVNRHREHIRRKLGIANRRLNLTAHLQSEPFREPVDASAG